MRYGIAQCEVAFVCLAAMRREELVFISFFGLFGLFGFS